jgi:hypothetical protein
MSGLIALVEITAFVAVAGGIIYAALILGPQIAEFVSAFINWHFNK